ncbi:MAG: DUF5131 family protein [Leptospirales bacterium]
MGDQSKIAWTDATWNPVSGCSKVSEGCRNCYAERDWPRLSKLVPAYVGRSFGDVACHEDRLNQPLRWKRPRKIFVNSMSDLFHASVSDEFIDSVFGVIWSCLWGRNEQPGHIFQILTKRPERMRDYLSKNRRENWAHAAIHYGGKFDPDGLYDQTIELSEKPHPRIWLGVSIEDQESADERIPLLLETPAANHWVSIEPMIGPVNLGEVPVGMLGPLRPGASTNLPKIDWVVVGGESGPNARPMEAEWVRKIKYKCEEAGTPLFVKQLGAAYSDPVDGIAGAALKIPEEAIYLLKRRLKHRSGADINEWPEDLKVREWPEYTDLSLTVSTCIGCGCTDDYGCDEGCSWLRQDRFAGLGVCSQCRSKVSDWDNGDRTMSSEAENDLS